MAGVCRTVLAATSFFAVFGYAVLACSSSGVPADWREVSAGSVFSLMAPHGTRFEPGQGADSLTGSFQTPDLRLSFDYGFYSDPLNKEEGHDNYEVRDVDINGKGAKIVTSYVAHGMAHGSTQHPYFIGVHFPTVKESPISAVKLTLRTSVKSKEDYDIVEKIFATIRFK